MDATRVFALSKQLREMNNEIKASEAITARLRLSANALSAQIMSARQEAINTGVKEFDYAVERSSIAGSRSTRA